MKIIILTIAAALSLSTIVASGPASAHLIEGTQILKGSIKTKIVVNTVKTTCKVKVDKVKNLMQEDSFGNPAYNVKIDLSLDGDDLQRNLTVRYDKEVWFNNLFTSGNRSEVRDLEYAAADGSQMNIDSSGRIKSVSFPYNTRTITCAF